MVFICDLNDKVYTLSKTTLNQGSSNASEIVLLAPYPGASVVSLAVTPPSLEMLEPIKMEKAELPDVLPEGIRKYSAWRCRIPAAFTELPGSITFQFFVVSGGETHALSAITQTINAGVGFVDPEVDTGSVGYVAQLVNAAQTAAGDAAGFKKDAEDAANDAAQTAAEAAANNVKSELSGYVTTVTNARNDAVDAKGAAEAASTNATTAWNDAESARREAIFAQGAAEKARNEAQNIKNSLETEVKAYIDTRFGDVTAVFEAVHEYAESIIGGSEV